MKRLANFDDLTALRRNLSKEGMLAPGKKRISVCCGTACRANKSLKLVDKLHTEVQRNKTDIELITTGCQGLCQMGPVMTIEPQGYFYHKVKPDRAEDIISRTMKDEKPLWDLLFRRFIGDKPAYSIQDVPFYRKQHRIALRHNGRIDPTNILHYIAIGGYMALEKALSKMTPQQVLDEVKKSNLRGRGGAGFPAGIKWEHTKKAPDPVKLVIANGDEGDPGAFMDRSIMEGDPHSLLEGMLLCAYAIGAQQGIIYVRHEYPLAVKHLSIAIKQAEDLGFLGKNILGKGFDFSVHIREGAGAFVCGEATALVASIEGERGFPNPRPPRLSEHGGGPWGYPANLNNIETYVCVPPIIEKGAGWFLKTGTANSPGTKVFALTGKVKNTGLVEVPMGITLREIIFDIGGGIIGNKKFKAVQTGGPSGGCIPEQYLDMPVDFDSLAKVGSIMGSGGMVVMDEDNCIVDVAKFFLSFCQAESCGKCYPCRVGIYQMLQILEKIASGQGEEGDIEKLETLGRYIKSSALCGLGKSAPNPVLTTIKYFRDEYEEHIRDKYCRAFVCQGLGQVLLNADICYQCKRCTDICPYDAIRESEDGLFYIDQVRCQRCKACFSVCPLGAIEIHEQPVLYIDKELCYFCRNCINICRVDAIKETSTGFMIDNTVCKKCGDCFKVCPMGAIKYEKEGKLLKKGTVAAVAVTAEKEEPIGEITIDEIRKDAEEKTCSVQKALTFIEEFIEGPMCGRCYPCSLGTEEAKIRLIRISQHRDDATESDIQALKRIAFYMIEGSYCKKGRDTGRFLAETIESAEEEFRLHLSGICPQKECISSIEYVVNPDLCIACGACAKRCKYDAIKGETAESAAEFLPFEIIQKVCVRCGECVSVCPTGAIEVISRIKEEVIII
jgi:NADH:ubiquinone oxidoreductase subunit F (NADH-binding)/MinD superfamily P-loop ATPase/(2Fe-2S) ferredoxin